MLNEVGIKLISNAEPLLRDLSCSVQGENSAWMCQGRMQSQGKGAGVGLAPGIPAGPPWEQRNHHGVLKNSWALGVSQDEQGALG